MTSCDYCEREGRYRCDECDAMCCTRCLWWVTPSTVLCSPDPATHPGRGCYKPPVAEVIENELQTLSVAGLLRIQRASQED